VLGFSKNFQCLFDLTLCNVTFAVYFELCKRVWRFSSSGKVLDCYFVVF
jgi:hypothetical protein